MHDICFVNLPWSATARLRKVSLQLSYLSVFSLIKRVFRDALKKHDIKRMLAPHYGILNEEQTKYFLDNMKSASENAAQNILKSLKIGKSSNEIISDFKAEFWHGYIKEIYPEDAIDLNTSIMIELIRKELM